MSLKYEPASVPQHISVKWLLLKGCTPMPPMSNMDANSPIKASISSASFAARSPSASSPNLPNELLYTPEPQFILSQLSTTIHLKSTVNPCRTWTRTKPHESLHILGVIGRQVALRIVAVPAERVVLHNSSYVHLKSTVNLP